MLTGQGSGVRGQRKLAEKVMPERRSKGGRGGKALCAEETPDGQSAAMGGSMAPESLQQAACWRAAV